MKHVLAMAMVAIFMGVANAAELKEFEKTQYNVTLAKGDSEVTYRHETSGDKAFLQYGHKLNSDFKLQMRYVTKNSENIEVRPRLTYSGVEVIDGVKIGARYEQRMFTNKSDYGLFWVQFKAATKTPVGKLTFMHAPKLFVGKDGESNGTISSSQTDIGLVVYNDKATGVKVEPFIEYNTDGDYEGTEVFAGVNLKVNF